MLVDPLQNFTADLEGNSIVHWTPNTYEEELTTFSINLCGTVPCGEDRNTTVACLNKGIEITTTIESPSISKS